MCEIPDREILFRYAKPGSFPSDQEGIPISIFTDSNLSCDWAKYQANPQDSFQIGIGNSRIIAITVCDEIKNPQNNGIVAESLKQKIIHAPVSAEDDPAHGENYSHSLIKGKKKALVTKAISRNSIIFKI